MCLTLLIVMQPLAYYFVVTIDTRAVSFTQAELWTNIHLGTAIICACLPTYRLLFKGMFVASSAIWSHLSSLFPSRRALKATAYERGSTYQMDAFQQNRNNYKQLDDPTGEHQFLSHAAAVTPTRSQVSDKDGNIEPNSIIIRNTVEVV